MRTFKTRVLCCVVAAFVLGVIVTNAPPAFAQTTPATVATPEASPAAAATPIPLAEPTSVPTAAPRHHNIALDIFGGLVVAAAALTIYSYSQPQGHAEPGSIARRPALGLHFRL
jgi:hypothetical protein